MEPDPAGIFVGEALGGNPMKLSRERLLREAGATGLPPLGGPAWTTCLGEQELRLVGDVRRYEWSRIENIFII